MENIYYFVLGVLSVLAIAGVYGMFRTSAQVKRLGTQINETSAEIEQLYGNIDEITRGIFETMDTNVRGLKEEIQDLDRGINEQTRDLRGSLDSRTDKLTNNMAEQISNVFTVIHKLEETIEKNAENLSLQKVKADK